MTIVSLRGTHGSGKSSVVAKILSNFCRSPLPNPDKPKKPWGYYVILPTGTLFVVGSYTTACGGCDAIQPYSDIWPLIEEAADAGHHVLFEGALVSSSYGNIGRSSEKYGDDVVFAFLDTPLATCLERIKTRRAANGNYKPLDPTNTEKKFNSVNKSIGKIKFDFGRRVAIIDHTQAVKQTLKLFGVILRKEP